MSGTELAYCAIVRCAMSSTDLADGAGSPMRCPELAFKRSQGPAVVTINVAVIRETPRDAMANAVHAGGEGGEGGGGGRGGGEQGARGAQEVNSAIGLRACYAMPGTDPAHGTICLRACYAASSTDGAIALRARYAMPGTDLTDGAYQMRITRSSGIGLRFCSAMPGTDVAYETIDLCTCYAMSGTDLAYRGTDQDLQSLGFRRRFQVSIRDVRY
eukprot:1098042-Rhodomonas_salina.1